MLDYQKRVCDERDELDAKYKALVKFIQSDAFSSVDSAEQTRLQLQSGYMLLYKNVLDDRIQNFGV